MLLELVNCKNEMHICLATFSDLVKGFFLPILDPALNESHPPPPPPLHHHHHPRNNKHMEGNIYFIVRCSCVLHQSCLQFIPPQFY